MTFPDDYLFWYQIDEKLHEYIFSTIKLKRQFDKTDKPRGALEYLYTYDHGRNPHSADHYLKYWIRANFSYEVVDGYAKRKGKTADEIEGTFRRRLNDVINKLNSATPWSPFYTVKCITSKTSDSLLDGHYVLVLALTDKQGRHLVNGRDELFSEIFAEQIKEISTYVGRNVQAVRFHQNTISAFQEKCKDPELKKKLHERSKQDRFRAEDFLSGKNVPQPALFAPSKKITPPTRDLPEPDKYLNYNQNSKEMLRRLLGTSPAKSEIRDFLVDNPRMLYPLAEGTDKTKIIYADTRIKSASIDFAVKAEYPTMSLPVWTFFLIDLPKNPLFNSKGKRSKHLRKAIDRIYTWRKWHEEIANKSLGRPFPFSEIGRCVILIGRRARISIEDSNRLKELVNELDRISIRTFDALLDE